MLFPLFTTCSQLASSIVLEQLPTMSFHWHEMMRQIVCPVAVFMPISIAAAKIFPPEKTVVAASRTRDAVANKAHTMGMARRQTAGRVLLSFLVKTALFKRHSCHVR